MRRSPRRLLSSFYFLFFFFFIFLRFHAVCLFVPPLRGDERTIRAGGVLCHHLVDPGGLSARILWIPEASQPGSYGSRRPLSPDLVDPRADFMRRIVAEEAARSMHNKDTSRASMHGSLSHLHARWLGPGVWRDRCEIDALNWDTRKTCRIRELRSALRRVGSGRRGATPAPTGRSTMTGSGAGAGRVIEGGVDGLGGGLVGCAVAYRVGIGSDGIGSGGIGSGGIE